MNIDRAMITAADYHDAIVVARRAKSAAALIVLLMLLGQLALFFVARYTDILGPSPSAPTTEQIVDAAVDPDVDVPPSTQPVAPPQRTADIAHYALGLTILVGFGASLILSIILMLLIKILLTGRALGVGPVTSAFVMSSVLLLLLFPWQAFLGGQLMHRDFIIPGVLYTWDELSSGAKFVSSFSDLESISQTCLRWARFVAFPIAAIVIVLLVQSRSTRGLRQAISEPARGATEV